MDLANIMIRLCLFPIVIRGDINTQMWTYIAVIHVILVNIFHTCFFLLSCYILSAYNVMYLYDSGPVFIKRTDVLLHGLTLIPAWINNYIHYKMWDEITYPFLNFNGCTVEV